MQALSANMTRFASAHRAAMQEPDVFTEEDESDQVTTADVHTVAKQPENDAKLKESGSPNVKHTIINDPTNANDALETVNIETEKNDRPPTPSHGNVGSSPR